MPTPISFLHPIRRSLLLIVLWLPNLLMFGQTSSSGKLHSPERKSAPKNKAATSASPDEIIEWIHSFLASQPVVSGTCPPIRGWAKERYELAAAGRCAAHLSRERFSREFDFAQNGQLREYDLNFDQFITNVEVSQQDLSCAISGVDPRWAVSLITVAGKKIGITCKELIPPSCDDLGTAHDPREVSKITLFFAEEASARRLAHALQDLIRECGGKAVKDLY